MRECGNRRYVTFLGVGDQVMNNRTGKLCQLVLLVIAGICLPPIVCASTVREANIEEVSLNTTFIFQGRVLSKETRPSPQDNRPYTYFTFEIVEVIKGTYPNKQIEIGFAGGTINGMTLSVTGLLMPDLQESGVYFVETLTREQIHPLYGWSQGHYIIDSKNHVSNVQQVSPGTIASRQALVTAPLLSDFKQQIRSILSATTK